MRGKGPQPPYSGLCTRITPTYAGKRTWPGPLALAGRDHPRVCGEKQNRAPRGRAGLGSPPRMRGKADSARLISRQTGITPAYAGKSRALPAHNGLPRDHPRVCGEKRTTPPTRLQTMGSPPRVRGKVDRELDVGVHAGITPACAGKSSSVSAGRQSRWGHPRVCGEKHEVLKGKAKPEGSPPRMQGKGNGPGGSLGEVGITPAYAGKSPVRYQRYLCDWDHPRVCGEKFDTPIIPHTEGGSPPRMRGKGHLTLAVSHMHRINPAYAGKRALDRCRGLW